MPGWYKYGWIFFSIFILFQIFQNLVKITLLYGTMKPCDFTNMAVVHIQVIVTHLCNEHSLIISFARSSAKCYRQ